MLILQSNSLAATMTISVRKKGRYFHVGIQKREVGTGGSDPLKITKNIGFLSNTGPNPLKKYKTTKPAFNVGPSSARQRNAI